MAIKSNKKIDFEYEFASQSGESSYSILLRFYSTEEYGPTIAVLDDDGEPSINFPVSMFSEVSDFLIEQGILENRKNISSPQVSNKLPRSTTSSSNRPLLPKPKLVSSKSHFVNPLKVGNKQVDAVEVDLEDEDDDDLLDAPDDMKESLQKEKDRLEGIQSAIEGTVPVHSLSMNAEQKELTEEEMQRIMEERQNARNKAKPAQKTVRRKEE